MSKKSKRRYDTAKTSDLYEFLANVTNSLDKLSTNNHRLYGQRKVSEDVFNTMNKLCSETEELVNDYICNRLPYREFKRVDKIYMQLEGDFLTDDEVDKFLEDEDANTKMTDWFRSLKPTTTYQGLLDLHDVMDDDQIARMLTIYGGSNSTDGE